MFVPFTMLFVLFDGKQFMTVNSNKAYPCDMYHQMKSAQSQETTSQSQEMTSQSQEMTSQSQQVDCVRKNKRNKRNATPIVTNRYPGPTEVPQISTEYFFEQSTESGMSVAIQQCKNVM